MDPVRALLEARMKAHRIRVVPSDPDPVAFPVVKFACDEYPDRCPDCRMTCSKVI
jgi:hypothetical protein